MTAIPQMELWFESAFDYLNTHTVSVSKENKLKFYGYFKQATTGDCTIPKPNLFEFVARAKWDAWNQLKGMPAQMAMEAYVTLAEQLDIGWTRQGEYESTSTQGHQDPDEDTGHLMSSLAHGDDDDDEGLIGYTKKNDLNGVREAIKETKEPVNTVDEEGLTALHHACDRGYTDMVKLLLDLGANVNATTNDMETPLHYGK
ncbi:acyl CoA binding protein-domain-containing protein [Chlamydoabsidia padenii]|nr:acyl CoA binding protein-domain-containing protein [Chlamydoabsidia padenii]